MLTLEVQERKNDPAEGVREQGLVPAVVYGHKEASKAIAVDARALDRIWKEAGHSSVVKLTGVGEDKDTLIKEVQVHPVSGRVVHADFYALEKGKKVQLAVPLEFAGETPAEKVGHFVVKALHEIEIEVAPQHLPHNLPVDMSKLVNVGDRILASDIKLPESAILITDGEEIVASVTEPVEEKEVAPAPAESAAAEAPKAEGEAAKA